MTAKYLRVHQTTTWNPKEDKNKYLDNFHLLKRINNNDTQPPQLFEKNKSLKSKKKATMKHAPVNFISTNDHTIPT